MNNQINMNEQFNIKKQPFKVPENYFNDLPEKILQQINEIPPSQNKTNLSFVIKRQLLAAAAFIGFFLLSYGIYKLVTTSITANKSIVKRSSYEEVLLAKVDEYDIINLLTEEEVDEKTFPEIIENYLVDEEINEQTINENIKP